MLLMEWILLRRVELDGIPDVLDFRLISIGYEGRVKDDPKACDDLVDAFGKVVVLFLSFDVSLWCFLKIQRDLIIHIEK